MFQLNVSQLLSDVLSAVSKYRVGLESDFMAVLILSVMVLEGLAKSLDPEFDLFTSARPYLLAM